MFEVVIYAQPLSCIIVFQMQLSIGGGASGFQDVGDPELLTLGNNGKIDVINLGSISVGPGNSVLRWDPRGLHDGATNTGTEFFAVRKVVLVVTQVLTAYRSQESGKALGKHA